MRILLALVVVLVSVLPAVAQNACEAQIQIIDITRRQYEATLAQVIAGLQKEAAVCRAELEQAKKKPDKAPEKPADPVTPAPAPGATP